MWAITGTYMIFPDPFLAVVDFFQPPNDEAPLRIGDTILEWFARVHIGRFSGMTVKLIWGVVGLVPVVLFVTGVIMWWNRKFRGWLRAEDGPLDQIRRRRYTSLRDGIFQIAITHDIISIHAAPLLRTRPFPVDARSPRAGCPRAIDVVDDSAKRDHREKPADAQPRTSSRKADRSSLPVARSVMARKAKVMDPTAIAATPPADLTLAARAAANPDGIVFYKIWNGRSRPTMPAFKSQMTRDQVWTLVEYVKTLRKPAEAGSSASPVQ